MKRIFTFLPFALWIYNVHAQSSSPEIVSSAGEIFQGNSMQIDWTLGELAIPTIQNSSRQITQGFHQPNLTITSVNELPYEIGQVQVYPNPTSEWIEMKLDFDKKREVKIQLSDLNGRLIWSKNNEGMQFTEKANLAGLSGATYLLTFLIDGNQYSKTFKIQKIK